MSGKKDEPKIKMKKLTAFFKSPGGSRAASEEDIVELPSKFKKGSSKKSKKDDRLNVSIERSGDDSDEDDGVKRLKDLEKKKDKKRKARVLSDSEEDDDFKSTPKKSSGSKSTEKPAAKQAKVEKAVKEKKEEKLVNPADFFGSAPVKRESRKDTKKEKEAEEKASSSKAAKSPEKKADKKSPAKSKSPAPSSSKATSSPKKQNGKHDLGESPQKPVTSIIEPKKLKMETPTPEKRDRSKSTKVETPPKTNGHGREDKSKKTPEKKKEATFKAPTPVTAEKSKSRTASTSKKRSTATEDDDEEEEDFDPRKKSSKSKGKAKPDKKDKKKKKDKTDEDEEAPTKKPATPQQKANYLKFIAKKEIKPPNLGSKPIPEGAPDCLEGLAFVITGVLDSIEREDCAQIIKKYGGRVTTTVSGKTTHLIIGDDPGESKLRKAEQLKLPQLSEDDFLEMLRKSNPSGNSQDSGLEPSSEDMSTEYSETIKTEDEYDADKSLFSSPATTKGSRSSPRKSARSPSKLASEETPTKKSKMEEPVKKAETKQVKEEVVEDKKHVPASPAPSTSAAAGAVDDGLMWVDKHKPKTLKSVVGQSSETSNAKKLVKWLNTWFNYHGHSTEKVKAGWPGLRDPEGKTFKAALLSGPPGIGKTTTAHLAVKEVGYDYFELNASDTRNKRGLHENVADALSSKSLVFGKNEELARKHVLIMDEVDGMSGNEDRGGVQELIALIKSSRVPIICICNDRNHQKIRSLSNYCYDLRFYKPTFEQMKAFIMSLCFKEKIKIPLEKIQQLIVSTDNDVRQILHQLQMFKEGKSAQAYNPQKDLRFGPWDVIRKVFSKQEHDKMNIHDKCGLFFQDYNIGPLFVQENYLKWRPVKSGGNRHKHMDLLSKTASSLADGDMVENVIRRSQNWSLLPVQGVFQSYIPGEYMESSQMGGVDFPAWLGKNSNKGKRHRLLQSLHSHLHLHVSGSLDALNMDYIPYLQRAITKPLIAGEPLQAAKVMEDYTLLRDDLEGVTELGVWPNMQDPMSKVETRVKTAFTRQVNKEILPYSIAQKPVRGRGRGGSTEELNASMEGEEGEVVEEEEEEEDQSLEKDAMVKVKTKKGGASKAGTSKAGASKATTAAKGKGKKAMVLDDFDDDDFDFDDDEEDIKPAKSSKSKAPAKSRKK